MTSTALQFPLRRPDREAFVEAMTAHSSGVVIVTSKVNGRPWGTTVTAFASVSAEVPAVLVSLGSRSPAALAIRTTGRFGVSILAAEQRTVAERFALPRSPKFLDSFVAVGDYRTASPVVAGALAHLDCDLVEEVAVADHTVFFGHVRLARTSRDGAPLVYHRRDYRTLAEPQAADWRE